MKSLSILILAAGRGIRMKSTLPKVLHPVGGTPIIDRVCRTAAALKPASVCVVVGYERERVREHILSGFPKTQFAFQKTQDGSGGAVRQAMAWLRKQKGEVVVLSGDVPLIRPETLQKLLDQHQNENNLCTVLTNEYAEIPKGYGRIVRIPDGSVEKIVEELDATDKERQIKEANAGIYIFHAPALIKVLPMLRNKNANKEFYLTDTLALLREDSGRIGACVHPDFLETRGVNDRFDLELLESRARYRALQRLIEQGVTIISSVSTFIDDDVVVGPDSVIWPQTFLLGKTTIGSGCVIGPWAHVKDAKIGNNVTFQASFAEDAVIKNRAKVGPYARVRPKSVVGEGAHLGNFCEIKNTRLGDGAKANHLSYLGDAEIGKNVNIGAGSITCNYDGFAKHPTQIDDHAFIGSNVNLIAPVRVGAHSVVGAGSSINEDVPAWSLALERAPRVTKKNWARSRNKKGKKR